MRGSSLVLNLPLSHTTHAQVYSLQMKFEILSSLKGLVFRTNDILY